MEELRKEAAENENLASYHGLSRERFETTFLNADIATGNIAYFIRKGIGFRMVLEYDPETETVQTSYYTKK